MMAQVGRVRHQRRHSDVSLAINNPDRLCHAGRNTTDNLLLSCSRTRLTPQFVSATPQGMDWPGGQRFFSANKAAHPVSPTSPCHSPLLQQRVDLSAALKWKLANDSPVQRGQRMGTINVIGSFSSSEEELVTTPEYSCDEPDSE